MPRSLSDPAVDAVMKAPPSVTATAGGARIPYPFPSPADWRDQWIYFLLVDRFDNPAGLPDPDVYPCDVYQGGTFAGVRRRLPYLRDLGVGAIWLSPVLQNPQWFDHFWGGYGLMDLLTVEPRYSSNPDAARHDPTLADAELRTLIDEAHAHGIYVILDIVLNHTGDLFNYEGMRDAAPWNPDREYQTYWRDDIGMPRGDWTDVALIPDLPPNAGVWPRELQRNDYFRRRGSYDPNGDATRGDFDRLKELVTEYLIPGTTLFPVRNLLIRAHQYLIAKFDLDGFRIDTLQYVEPEFSRVFGNAMREYALAIGKRNFFTFGEVWQEDDEAKIAQFVGRDTARDEDFIGVDAAIDFPIRKRLVGVCKGWLAPEELARHFDYRRETLRGIVSSHGDASGLYVTFLDNHDLNERFHFEPLPEQTKLALSCLMTIQGIPCIYYGTEQGLAGRGDRREYVREALWGRPDAFSTDHDLFRHIQDLSQLRDAHPALRYGRQYFRQCSGNGVDFGYSPYPGGLVAFSRVLNDQEVLVVANTSTTDTQSVDVVVDHNLSPEGRQWQVLFPFGWSGVAPEPTATRGALRTVRVTVRPMEALVLA